MKLDSKIEFDLESDLQDNINPILDYSPEL